MKRWVLQMCIVICIGLTGCGKQQSEKYVSEASCSEDDYIWEENTITALSDMGKAKTSLMIPKRCEGFASMVFTGTQVKYVTFESEQDVSLNGAFLCATGLEKIVLPQELTTIGDFEFWECAGITDIVIPAEVAVIGEYAFENATALENVEFAGEVKEIQEHAFDGCTSLKQLEIPDSVQTLGAYAYANCTALKKVTLPENLIDAGEYVFYGCAELKTILVPENMQLETYMTTSLGQVNILTLSEDAPGVKVVKGSWADENFEAVFGKFHKKYHK